MLSISTVSAEELRKQYLFDLPVLACRAAYELDEYRLQRGSELTAARFTAQWLKDRLEEYKPGSFPTSDLILLWRVMQEAELITKSVRTVDVFMPEVEKLCARFDQVIEQAKWEDQSQLKELNAMRDFCLKLSKQALATYIEERPRRLLSSYGTSYCGNLID